VTDRETVQRWVAAYETAWRTPGTAGLAVLFSPDATYLLSPYEEPIAGLDQISRMWEDERDGPDEIFALTSEIVAVETRTAVVRVDVRYGDPVRQEYRDLWVMTFDSAGTCQSFEEWPFWPGRPYSAHGTDSAP
jgi:ketosteroid isomerase-like protein